MSRRLRVLSWVALAITGTLFVAVMVPTLLGLKRYAIVSGSMVPTLPVGSIVYDEVVPVEELAVGDVITFVPPPGYGVDDPVTHRIASATPFVTADGTSTTEFRTKGDANVTIDPWTFVLDSPEQARMVHHLPYLGYVYLLLHNRWVIVLLIGLPALAIGGYIVLALWRLAGDAVRDEHHQPGAAAAAVVVLVLCGAAVVPETRATFTDVVRSTQSLSTASGGGGGGPSGLRAQARRYDTDDHDAGIVPGIRLVNDGTVPIDLATVTVRYWFSEDGASGTVDGYCYYATLGCGVVVPTVVEAVPAREGGDHHLELRFTSGSLAPGGDTGDAQVAARSSNGSPLDETNDYSRTTTTEYSDTTKVTAYIAGTLVWGIEPAQLTSGARVEVRYANLDQGGQAQSINPGLDVRNTGSERLDLPRVTIRYWFTGDGVPASELTSFCDWAQLSCSSVRHSAGPAGPALTGADAYLEVGFVSGSLGVGASTGPILLRIMSSTYASFDEEDDHSHGTNADYVVWERVTGYVDGTLAWGAEPA